MSASEILLYQTEGGLTRIDIRLEGESLWLTQAQMAELFQTTPQNVTLHLKAIYREGELLESATCKEYLQVRQEGSRRIQRELRHYNLEAVHAVGYWIKSQRGAQFRVWATRTLRDSLVKGFTLDDERLKCVGGDAYFEALLARNRRTMPMAYHLPDARKVIPENHYPDLRKMVGLKLELKRQD